MLGSARGSHRLSCQWDGRRALENAFSARLRPGLCERIAETGGEDFYRGALAEKIAADAARLGGQLTEDDLAAHRPDWVGTIEQDYRGYQLHEIPPNGQGLGALLCLGILRHVDVGSLPVDSVDSLHVQIEAAEAGVGRCLSLRSRSGVYERIRRRPVG